MRILQALGNGMMNTFLDHKLSSTSRSNTDNDYQKMYSHTIPAYVYYIRHIPSGKFYYGSRYKHITHNIKPDEDLWKRYFTSSKEILKLIEQSGKDSFEYKIIYTNVDTNKCFEYEQNIIKEYITDPLCVNKRYFDSNKGSTVFCIFGKTLSSKGKPKSEETKNKMRKSKSEEHKRNISKAQLARGGNGPSKHKEGTKIKIANSLRLNPREDVTCPHCGKTGGAIAMPRWHFDNCKEK